MKRQIIFVFCSSLAFGACHRETDIELITKKCESMKKQLSAQTGTKDALAQMMTQGVIGTMCDELKQICTKKPDSEECRKIVGTLKEVNTL